MNPSRLYILSFCKKLPGNIQVANIAKGRTIHSKTTMMAAGNIANYSLFYVKMGSLSWSQQAMLSGTKQETVNQSKEYQIPISIFLSLIFFCLVKYHWVSFKIFISATFLLMQLVQKILIRYHEIWANSRVNRTIKGTIRLPMFSTALWVL